MSDLKSSRPYIGLVPSDIAPFVRYGTPVSMEVEDATSECVELLRDLIRIPSVNPPGIRDDAAGLDSTGGEARAAAYCAEVLTEAGIEAQVLEVAPGRGSCFARLPATVPDPEPPLILLSHVDVVPVDAEAWTHDPFGGQLIDGQVWGRGAVDMKDMVAMELSVMLALRREQRELKRDVILAAVADEEAGGTNGALHWVEARPDLFADAAGRPAAAALNEVGGYSMTVGGRRTYAIQVAEKGIIWTRMRATGTPSHGSMPSPDNAAIKLANAASRLAAARQPSRPTPVVRGFFEGLGLDHVLRLAEAGDDEAVTAAIEAAVSEPTMQRSLDGMLRDTVTPNVIHVGKKVNVVPGFGEAEIDVRTVPGTDQEALLRQLQEIAGDDVTVESVMTMPPVVSPDDAPIVTLMREALQRADPEATPLPMMITLGTDGKALARLGIPTYGFTPLRLEPDFPYLSLWHANDERIPVSALRFGLPVLYEVVSGFAGAD
jgi:acetylornithine deacetylase/succinyl-diaminopimelate desuccinylase-like protein